LGDQLIRNERVAVLELVKNSYDADSPFVIVEFSKADDKEKGSIMIYDEGEGMDLETIKNKWLVLGTDYKKQQYDEKQRTPKFKRMPLGEKGIGRLAVQKLGSVTEITSKKKGSQEIFVRIDWKSMEDFSYLDEIAVKVEERPAELFKEDKTGTKIVVRSLNVSWTEATYKRFYENALNFSSPFRKEGDFSVEVKSDKDEWGTGIPKIQDYIEDSLFSFSIDIKDDAVIKFLYKFTPPADMDKVKARELTDKNETMVKLLKLCDSNGKLLNLHDYAVGPLHFEGFIYDRDPLVLKMSTTEGSALKKYLNDNGGIRVYRDAVRVYDYGESGNDWLELGIRRINQPASRISNNIILGAVSLDREKSANLVEKTNREGFIENDAFEAFKNAVKYALSLVETQRNIDKRVIRTAYGKATKDVLSVTGDLKDIVKARVKDDSLKEEFLIYLDRIESGYTAIRETFIKSASAGLSIGIAIHEIQKIVKNLEDSVKQDNRFAELRPLVKRISDLVEGYGYLLKKSHRVYQPLSTAINTALFDMDYRLKSHNIRVFFRNIDSKCNPKFSSQMIIGALLNIIDNSIWWLDYSGRSEKLLFISIVEKEKKVSVIIADNGTGFTLPLDTIGEPFISGKPDGTGLGLHIVKTIMQVNNGTLNFPSPDEVEIPDKFKEGAILELCFNDVEVC
jgi:signal transduction histidine kinase